MQDAFIVVLCISPLIVHIFLFGGDAKSRAKFGAIGLGLAFCFFAVGRLVIPDELVAMLPPWIPQRLAIIYATGILELGIAMALFTARWRRMGGIAATTVLILFFPANIYAAFNSVGQTESVHGPNYLWIRGPLQLLLVLWTYWPISWKQQPIQKISEKA